MRQPITSFVFFIISIGFGEPYVAAQVVDKSASILTVPEKMGRELRHPTNVKECLSQIYQSLPPVTVQTKALQVNQANINYRLHVIVPFKEPTQGIQKVHWVAESWAGAKWVLQLLQDGRIEAVKILPFDSHSVPSIFWAFNKQDRSVQEDLKACKKERISKLFLCQDCLIIELVGVTP